MGKAKVTKSLLGVGLASGFMLAASVEDASAACLRNEAGRTVIVTLNSAEDHITNSMVVGETLCVKARVGNKATAKIVPYVGARLGCKIEIVGDETMVLVRFGTMNNCDLVPGR